MLRQCQELQLEDVSQESIQGYKTIAVNTRQVVDSFTQGLMEKFGDSLAADSNPVQFKEKLETAFSKMGWTYIKSLLGEFKSSLNLQISIGVGFGGRQGKEYLITSRAGWSGSRATYINAGCDFVTLLLQNLLYRLHAMIP